MGRNKMISENKNMSQLYKKLKYRVAILGCPADWDVQWNAENLQKLKAYGFNTIQLNIAWGARPADEPLNLEDVVDLPPSLQQFSQKLPLKSDTDIKQRQKRQNNLRERISLCKKVGLRTIFHFGAPYNGSNGYDGSELTNCILDEHIVRMYQVFIEQFNSQFPGVDDLFIYTYDQDAWLCSEFGECENCSGVPLHLRSPHFVNALGQKWKSLNPNGLLWWEPWEHSAGQFYYAIGSLDSKCVGLSLHSNIGEVTATLPVDRWLQNSCLLAKKLNIAVMVEGWLGAASEELEPFTNLAHPFTTFRQVKKIAAVEGVCGIKEYYGLLPQKPDANLEATSKFIQGVEDERQAIKEIADAYCQNNQRLIEFWELCSQAMELFPWDTSWYIREIGKSCVHHSTDAAFIRGQQCQTPVWESTRRSIFMKTDDIQPHPWMLEDVQLRCAIAADKMEQAVSLAQEILRALPDKFKNDFEKCVYETTEFMRRARAYQFHLRETNIAYIMRKKREKNAEIPASLIEEMRQLLEKDIINQNTDKYLRDVLDTFNSDIDDFLNTYFKVVEGEKTQGGVNLSPSDFSLTSRTLPCPK